MNFTLHWLRRDLRRHAPALALWALLVALFTWARTWLRTHPQFLIGDRDLWLSVPAAGLGIAEVCLLLRVLLDDPARGPHAFWKSRPPSGAAVFAAKAIVFALAALVIPFAAEGVFLAAVGPSAGTPERTSLYLLPPVLALMAGAVAAGWKGTLLWLPVVVGIIVASFAGALWMEWSGRLDYPADHRLVSLTVLVVVLAAAAFIYQRRTAGRWHPIAALAAPAVAGLSMAATGWPRDARLHTPPPGLNTADIHLGWLQDPEVSRHRYEHYWGLGLPLRVRGLENRFTDATLRDVSLLGEGIRIKNVPLMERERHIYGYGEGKQGAFFHVRLSDAPAKAITGKPWTLTGTLVLRVFDRTHHSLSLDRTHTVDAGDCRWIITPAVPAGSHHPGYWFQQDEGGLWYGDEFTSTAPMTKYEWTLIDRESARLRHTVSGKEQRQINFSLGQWFLIWEGIGRGGNRLDYGVEAVAEGIKDPANWKDWTLDFDTLTLSGTLEVPFSLHVPRE